MFVNVLQCVGETLGYFIPTEMFAVTHHRLMATYVT